MIPRTGHGRPSSDPASRLPLPRRTVHLTVDAEPDCPPYLWTWRGMEEGAPALLDLLREEGVPTTVFTTGETARRHPEFVERVVAEGHELASHGLTHTPFTLLSRDEADREIRETSAILREHAPVTSFRAPNLRFPDAYLRLLEADGYRVDSSRGKYKPAHWRPSAPTSLERIPASVTSSWLRLAAWLRDPVLRRLESPVVLFVHPWEFVDLRSEAIPWDSRAGTGAHALGCLRDVIRTLREEGSLFTPMASAGDGSASP